jgi:hypothetical protein
MTAALPPRLEQTWHRSLDVNAILRAQGADPDVVRRRSMRLVGLAERALRDGVPLLKPRVIQRRFRVESASLYGIRVQGGAALTGDLIAPELGGARAIVILAVTVGEDITLLAGSRMQTEPALGLALDGLGSAAVEALANVSVAAVAAGARSQGWGAGLQLSPGMVGWPLESGQRELFALLPNSGPIRLTGSGMMYPHKSLSMVVGVGPGVSARASTCDYCAARTRCRHHGRAC